MWPSRRVAPKDDLDLTPPEEQQARRRKRLFLLALPVVTVLAVAIYFGASPVSGAIKGWQSRRLAHQAFVLIEQKQWSEADAKARDAFLLRPTEPEAWRAIARLHSRTGQSATALEWWKKVDEANRLTTEDRRDFAKAALVAGELTTAATQIDQLLAQREGPQPVDILLAGQLAVRRGDTVRAGDYAQRVVADKRAKPNDVLSAAILILGITKPDSPPHIDAWKHIEDIARDPGNVESLDALVFLAQHPKPTAPATPAGAARAVTTMSTAEIADRLEKHPKALPFHQLLALKVRAGEDRWHAGDLLNRATDRYRGGD